MPWVRTRSLLFRGHPGPNLTLLLSRLAAGLSSTTPCTALCPWESTWPPSSGCTPPGSTGSGTISFFCRWLSATLRCFFKRGESVCLNVLTPCPPHPITLPVVLFGHRVLFLNSKSPPWFPQSSTSFCFHPLSRLFACWNHLSHFTFSVSVLFFTSRIIRLPEVVKKRSRSVCSLMKQTFDSWCGKSKGN